MSMMSKESIEFDREEADDAGTAFDQDEIEKQY